MVNIQCRDKIFSNIQAVLFDKNGTLEDSEINLRNFAQKTARIVDAQIPGTGEPLLMAFGVNGNNLDVAGLMAVASRRETEIATAAYIAETGRSWIESLEIARKSLDEADEYFRDSPSPLFTGGLEILQKLSQSGLKLGILSAATTEEVKSFVEFHKLSDYIQLEMGVDDSLSKPEPALFLQACERLGVEANATLMVGDSIGDMQMANNAGAAGSIGISWINQLGNVRGANVVINRLDEINIF